MSTDARKRELIESLLRQRGVDPASLPIGPRSADDGPAPLSFAQERLWIVERFAPGRPTYNEAYEVRLRGRLGPAALAATLHELSRRHASLRTTFEERGGTAVQAIGEPGLPMPVVDLSGLPDGPRSAEADRRGREEAELPFDLERGPVARALLLRLGGEDHRLLLVLHHIVSDATSMEILVTELMEIHRAFARGEASPLPEPRLQYADFAQWQREKQASSLEQQLARWKERLAGAPTVLELPSDRPRSEQPRGRGGSLAAALPGDLSRAVRELAQAQGATLFMTLLSAFDALLYRYTGRQDLLVGTPVAGRTRAEIERVVGFFVNTLVLRADLAGDPPFTELLARNRRSVLAAYDHQDVPFGRLVEELRPERAASHAPLIQVMFLLQKPGVPVEDRDGLAFEMRRIETGTAKFDLTFLVRDAADGIVCGVEYDSDLFLPATMSRLLGHFRALLETVTADPGRRLSELVILTALERQQLLAEWDGSARARPRACIHELFAAQAARTPDSPALIFEDRPVSYGDLNADANRLARRLRALGLRTDDLAGICLDPSPDLMVAVLGILKAGGAYVPLDPGQPAERLAWLLEDTGLRIVLTDSTLAGRLPETRAQVLRLDQEREALALLSPAEPEPRALPESLAYQIYTSGSTGRPKGVMVPHAGLVNLALSFAENWRLGPGDRMLMLLSLAFDASVGDLFPPLVSGATLVLHRTPQALLGRNLDVYLERQGITCIELAAAFWQQWADDLAARNQAPPSSLRTLVVGGESVALDKVRTWYRLLAGRPFRFLNHYGPTEATVCASFFKIDEGGGDPGYTRLPIGRSLANVRLCLLDPDLQPVPVGVPGELCIGGIGVARGYLGRADVTAERFIPEPFAGAAERGARLYRTGDLVRRLPDGNLDFLGRVDHQVKIRGYRIEPGEIEAALAEHPALRESVVLARAGEPGPRRLVAYVVAGSEPAPAAADLRAFLKAKLPAHMVPEAFVFLDRLPLNANGKVDRKALPRPVFDAEAAPAALESGLQRQIAQVWRELLGVERIGLHDNFFDLGGHSLLLIRMEGRLRDVLGRPVEVIDLFRHPTVSSLAEHLEGESAPARTAGAEVRPHGREIAIVGMAGRFPGARTIERFWTNLRDGVESVTFFTDDELRGEGVPARVLADPRYVKARGVLQDVDRFDAELFGYSPREAEVLDPQHRQFLECAWEALESAGYDPDRHPGPIGVFAGVGRNSYFVNNLASQLEQLQSAGLAQILIGNDKDFLPTRVSYHLNLQGPSIVVQSACSTSLVAVHMASRSLLDGECDMALAGGVTIPVPLRSGYFHEEGGIVSPDGHCRAFDAEARGTVPGSGAGVVVLKRLADAQADGDTVLAVIKGSAVNNDGRLKVGYTAPSPAGQARVIGDALARAGVNAASISYIETHGTGTQLGDLIEISALREAFGTADLAPGACALGALKTNVGHMDTAAGVGGLIKTVLALRHGQIPPTLHFREAASKLELGGSPFFVNTELRDWHRNGTPRRAGVSSFGIGGTNAHVIVEEAPEPAPEPAARSSWQLVPLSARTEAALDTATERLARHLGRNPGQSLADAAWTLQAGRRAFAVRRFAVCRDPEEAAAVLKSQVPGRVFTARAPDMPRAAAFLFSGRGTADGERVREALALAELWQRWGVRPEAVIGEGPGEIAAACMAGAISLDSAVDLASAWGRDRSEVERVVATVERKLPRLSWLSRRTGSWVTPEEAVGERFWLDLLSGPDRAPEPPEPLPQASPWLLVEMTPGEGLPSLLTTLGHLWLAGLTPQWAALHPRRPHRVPLPTYPFEGSRYWIDPPRPGAVEDAPEEIAVPAAAQPRRRPRPWLATPHTMPGTETEQRIAAVWEELLGIEGIGIYDNYFELGGHSLIAIRLLGRIRDELLVDVELDDLLAAPTVADLAEKVASARQMSAEERGIRTVPRDMPLPLSFVEEEVRRNMIAPEGLMQHNTSGAYRGQGDLDIPLLEWALNQVIRRHEVLRTTFPVVEGRPVQRIAPEMRVHVPVVDLLALPEERRQAELELHSVLLYDERFDLDTGPFLRMVVFLLGEKDYGLVRTIHRIITDGGSIQIFSKELMEIYRAALERRCPDLPERPDQYADFAAWERRRVEEGGMLVHRDYWREQLRGAPSLLGLRTDWPRPQRDGWRGTRIGVPIDRPLTEALRSFARSEGATLYMVLLALFELLLHEWSGQEDILVATPITLRPAEAEAMQGRFLNTIALRVRAAGNPTFRELLARVKKTAVEAFIHKDWPYELQLQDLQPRSDGSYRPLLQTSFLVQEGVVHLDFQLGGMVMTPVWVDRRTAEFELSLSFQEVSDGLDGYLEYRTGLFRPETAERMVERFRTMLQAALAEPDLHLSDLVESATTSIHR